eukprot:tig00020592_g11647.t1
MKLSIYRSIYLTYLSIAIYVLSTYHAASSSSSEARPRSRPPPALLQYDIGAALGFLGPEPHPADEELLHLEIWSDPDLLHLFVDQSTLPDLELNGEPVFVQVRAAPARPYAFPLLLQVLPLDPALGRDPYEPASPPRRPDAFPAPAQRVFRLRLRRPAPFDPPPPPPSAPSPPPAPPPALPLPAPVTPAPAPASDVFYPLPPPPPPRPAPVASAPAPASGRAPASSPARADAAELRALLEGAECGHLLEAFERHRIDMAVVRSQRFNLELLCRFMGLAIGDAVKVLDARDRLLPPGP